MAEASDISSLFCQNLIEAGCEKEIIEKCIALAKKGKKADLLLLSCHKNNLLTEIRKNQKNIDCLDFLTYTIKKENNTEK